MERKLSTVVEAKGKSKKLVVAQISAKEKLIEEQQAEILLLKDELE